MNSPWRDRPISESLKLFEDMKNGLVEEGKATLRMKQDMQSDNYNMYDLIAYRIKVSTCLDDFDDSNVWGDNDPISCDVNGFGLLVYSAPSRRRQMVYLSKLWLCSLHCWFSREYHTFSKLSCTQFFLGDATILLLVAWFLLFYYPFQPSTRPH